MLNQVVVVGRVISFKDNTIIISVPETGGKDNEVVVVLSKGLTNSLMDVANLNTSDLVGVKGKVKTGNIIEAEKITFIGSRKED